MNIQDGPFKMLSGHIGGANWKHRPEILEQYNELLRRLYGESVEPCDVMTLYRVLDSASEHLFFLAVDGRLVSSLQMSLALAHPVCNLYINNVVTLRDYEGRGYGKQLMQYATDRLTAWYSWKFPRLRLTLTNAPSKGNAGFYEKLGFQARTKANQSETVVWVKDLF